MLVTVNTRETSIFELIAINQIGQDLCQQTHYVHLCEPSMSEQTLILYILLLNLCRWVSIGAFVVSPFGSPRNANSEKEWPGAVYTKLRSFS